MTQIIYYLLEFFIIVLFVYGLTYIFTIRKNKEYDLKKSPVTIKYLVKKYKLNLSDDDYYLLLNATSLIDAVVLAFVFVITTVIDNFVLRIVTAFLLMLPLSSLLYYFVAMYIKRKED
ncbi:MAG TPA: hypothetical protein PKY25_02835 [Bacilli bacterium]|nr:hypothetical protein [Bacilli bacterium]